MSRLHDGDKRVTTGRRTVVGVSKVKPARRFIWRPHRRSVTCEWCGKRWAVGPDQDSPASAEVWIDEAGTVLCPDCLRPIEFSHDPLEGDG